MGLQEKLTRYVEGQAIPEPTECFAVPGSDSMIDVIHPATGKTACYGKTLEEVRQEPGYETAERMPIDQWRQEKAARQDGPIRWDEITAEQYEYYLECLPPAAYGRKSFLVGEPDDHHARTGRPRYRACRIMDGKHYQSSRPLTVQEFQELTRT